MNSFEQHPDSELLDRLRSGLLDDEPQLRSRVEQHLQTCPACRRSYHWPASLQGAGRVSDAQLDALRRQALAAPAQRTRRWLPLAAAAALALAAVGLISLLPSPQSPRAPQVAVSEPNNVPDLYEDLDFYLWLADHKGSGDSST